MRCVYAWIASPDRLFCRIIRTPYWMKTAAEPIVSTSNIVESAMSRTSKFSSVQSLFLASSIPKSMGPVHGSFSGTGNTVSTDASGDATRKKQYAERLHSC